MYILKMDVSVFERIAGIGNANDVIADRCLLDDLASLGRFSKSSLRAKRASMMWRWLTSRANIYYPERVEFVTRFLGD